MLIQKQFALFGGSPLKIGDGFRNCKVLLKDGEKTYSKSVSISWFNRVDMKALLIFLQLKRVSQQIDLHLDP